MTELNLDKILLDHAAWLRGDGVSKANLDGADLRGANLGHANLDGASLGGADLDGANLRGADLDGANLRGADLRCSGNMSHIKTMQIDRWMIGYTSDTLQIGCQRHTIDKWRKWTTSAGRKWIESMDDDALEWADRHLSLVLQIIDASPAVPTKEQSND